MLCARAPLFQDLKKRGVPVQDVFEKLDKAWPQYQSLKAQLQRIMGKQQFSFPQTFVRGVYQGDYDEVIAKADGGAFADFFQEQFGIVPPAAADAQASSRSRAQLDFFCLMLVWRVGWLDDGWR